jgi:hypothetical protein
MENETHDQFYGIIEEFYPETDYQLAAGSVELPRPRHTFEDNKIQYNQNEVSGISCTLHAAMTAMSALTGYRFTDEQRKFLWSEVEKDPSYLPGQGWYVHKAVDLVRKWASIWLKEEFVSYRFTLGSQEAFDLAEKGYLFVTGYRGNGDYNMDHYSDGRLNNVTFKKLTYGHAICDADVPEDKLDDRIIDNYYTKDSTNNIYLVNKEILRELVSNSIYFKEAYVFAFKSEIEHPASLISPWAVSSVEKAKKHGITNWETPKQIVGDAILEAMLVKVGLLTSTLGNVTKERLAVTLDRAHLLD